MFCVILVIYIMTHARISCDRKLLLENRTKQHAILLSDRSGVRITSGTPNCVNFVLAAVSRFLMAYGIVFSLTPVKLEGIKLIHGLAKTKFEFLPVPL